MSIERLTPQGQKFVSNLVNSLETQTWNEAIDACVAAQPATAENPNEDTYQRAYFDGVMAYGRAIQALRR